MGARRHRGHGRIRATVAGAVLLTLAIPAPAVALAPRNATLAEGERTAALWYLDALGVTEARDAGLDGKGVTIAVIEGFVNTRAPELSGTDLTVRGSVCLEPATGEPKQIDTEDAPLSAHATNVISMLVGNGRAGDGGVGATGIVPGATVWFYGTGQGEKEMGEKSEPCDLQDPTVEPGEPDLVRDLAGTYDPATLPEGFFAKGNTAYPEDHNPAAAAPLALAARAAIRDGADILSISMGGGLDEDWQQVMIEASRAGVAVVSGTPNPGQELSLASFAGGQNGGIPVNAVKEDNTLLSLDEEGWMTAGGQQNMAGVAPGWNLLGVGDDDGWGAKRIQGTSFATPLVAGMIALAMQRYPDATPFQVLQMMIRTTDGGSLHEPQWQDSEFGYGMFNAKGMMTVDPTQFPDLNPFYLTDRSDPRCTWPEAKEGSLLGDALDLADTSQCYYAAGPFPGDEVAYWTLRSDLSEGGSADAVPAAANPFITAAIVIGVFVLALIATAIVVPLVLRRRRRRVGSTP